MILRSSFATILKTEDELDSANSAYDFVLINYQSVKYDLIGAKEARVWELLSTNRNVSDIVAALSLETRKFEQKYVEELIRRWLRLGFVLDQEGSQAQPAAKWYQKLFWWEIPFANFDKYVAKLWRLIDLIGKSDIPQGSILIVFVSGMVLLIQGITNSRVQFFEELTLPLFILLIVTGLIMLALHELGHALAMKWAGAQVLRAGFGLYLGLPIAFVDTSTVWAKRRYKRIITACAGMMMNLFVISVASWLTYLVQNTFVQTLMWEIIFMNAVMIAFSLLPFVKMDGYYILLDLVGIPNLQKIAFTELREFESHPTKFKFSKQNFLFLVFGLISLLFSGLLLIYSGWYWWRLVNTFIRLV